MSLARSYALAFYEVLHEEKASEAIFLECQNGLGKLVSALQTSSDLSRVFASPHIGMAEKISVVRELAEKLQIHARLKVLLQLLASKGRIHLLPEVALAFEQVVLEARGYVSGLVRSPEELPEAERKKLENAFEKVTHSKVALKVELDPTLIAGLQVVLQGVTYDGSLKTQLQKLKESLLESHF
jgi:F-type H+-transporting ATPase subunit delta